MKFQADPFDWPKCQGGDKTSFALIVIDMQNDYLSPNCYMDKAGYDLDNLRKPVESLKSVLQAARDYGIEVIYTRHSENLDSSNNTDDGTSAYQSFGWEIAKEVQPSKDEKIFNKTTVSAFLSGGLHEYLQEKGIKYLVFCGNTIDVCVHSSLRTADDFGYECLLIEDCCGAVNDELHKWSVESVKVEGGVFGAVTNSKTFITDLEKTK